jgi:hypothetical protein
LKMIYFCKLIAEQLRISQFQSPSVCSSPEQTCI